MGCFLITSCKKESPQSIWQFSFSGHALEYVQLPVGKYFIYKDSANSQLDSVIVTTSKLENIFVPKDPSTLSGLFLDGNPAHFYEEYNLTLTKVDNNQQTEWFKGIASLHSAINSFNLPKPCDTVAVSMSSKLGQENFFGVFYCSESNHPNLSMTIEGKTYNNVVEYIHENYLNTTDPDYKKVIYYWVKSIGIIKRTVIHGSSIKTYTLVRNG